MDYALGSRVLSIVGKLSTRRGAPKSFRSFWTYGVEVMN